MTKKAVPLVTVVALFFVAIGCSSFTKGKEVAEGKVSYFHEQLNAEQYAEIYRQSDERFKNAVKEADSTALFEAVHRKLGKVKNATVTSWKVDSTPAGTFVSLAYKTEFTGGDGVEQFRFLVKDDLALLVNYNINSPLLIIK